MTLPSEFGPSIYLDGSSARGTRVAPILDDTRGALVFDLRGQTLSWPYADLRALPDQAGADRMVLRPVGEDVARLVLLSPHQSHLLAVRAGRLTRVERVHPMGKIAAWAAAAIGSVALIIFLLVPIMANQLADFLPPEGEKALGDATLGQIRSALDETGLGGLADCTSEAGLAAFAKMQDRLAAQANLPVGITLHVLDHDMVNAFALPGGHIIFFRGLLDQAGSAEEVAAVFAHEMGHVEARDPTRIALRSAGSIGVLGLLFGDFAGGAAVLVLTERLIQAEYTRSAEAAADDYAHRVLIGAGVSPAAIGTFFDRLRAEFGDEEGSILAHWASHPEMGDRIEASRAAVPTGFVGQDMLTHAEWKALKQICNTRHYPEPLSGLSESLGINVEGGD